MTKPADDTADLVSIGELARAAGVSSRTIRYYEELGILPEPRRSAGGTRKYPSEYRSYIEAALNLKELGFPLAEIKPLARLVLGRAVSAGQRDLAARLVDDKIAELAQQVAALRRLQESVRGPEALTPVPADQHPASVPPDQHPASVPPDQHPPSVPPAQHPPS